MDDLLKESGHEGIFLKVHKDQVQEDFEFLWLEEGTGLDVALAASKDDKVYGLAEKGAK